MAVFSRGSLRLPTPAYLRDRRVSKGLLAAMDLSLLLLYTAGVLDFQPYQVMAVLFSLILAANPGEDPAFLTLATLISVAPLTPTLVLALLALLIFTALCSRRLQGRFGLYLLATIALTALLTYLQHPFPALVLPLLLIGMSPFHKWLVESYSTSPSLTVLSSFVALTYLKAYQGAYGSIAPLLLMLAPTMMLVGLFKGGICKSISEAYSVLHQMVFGLLALLGFTKELTGLFDYLLVPCALSLFIIYHIHGYLSDAVKGQNILEFGGLSKKLRLEAAYTFATYIVLFGSLTVGAEALMYNGMTLNIGFLPVGCVALFVSAASLAVFFRFYTLIYEGLPRIDISSSRLQKVMVTALSTMNFTAAVIATFPANVLSWMNMTARGTPLEVTNLSLVVTSVGAALSLIVARATRTVKTEPWSTGYGGLQELSRQRGEIFTLWKEILNPLYAIRVPDEQITGLVGKVHPSALLVMFILLTYFLR